MNAREILVVEPQALGFLDVCFPKNIVIRAKISAALRLVKTA